MAEVSADGVDALAPPEIASKAVAEGVKSAGLGAGPMIVLGLLAGSFIALGGMFSTTVAAGADGVLPYGVGQFLSGFVFTLGLALVLVGGAELFTGNTMTIVAARAERELTARPLLRNWSIVYTTNFVGSMVIVGLVFLSGQFTLGDGAVGAAALATAQTKVQLTFVEAVASGILANFLVCLGVWLSYSARSTTDKIVAMILPIWAFVAAGFEHSVANMFLVPIGLVIKDGASSGFWADIGSSPAAFADLTWSAFFLNNLLPATLGNIIGGGVMVGVAYWSVYLRS